jgi:hypothetical protein
MDVPTKVAFSPYMRARQPSDDTTDDNYPYVYEQGLDRLACALGGKNVLPPAFQYIPAMLSSHDWKHRHAGLMAIANLAEGTAEVIPTRRYQSFRNWS